MSAIKSALDAFLRRDTDFNSPLMTIEQQLKEDPDQAVDYLSEISVASTQGQA